MPDWLGSAGQLLEDWKYNLSKWKPPSMEEMDFQFGDDRMGDYARAWTERMIGDTNAEAYLSPFYLNALRKNSVRPYLQQHLLSATEYGGAEPGNYGDFFKNWLSMSPSGVGHVGDLGARVQNLLGRIMQGRQDMIAGSQTPNAEIYSAYYNNPAMMAALMQMGHYGPMGEWQANRMSNLMTRAQAATASNAGVDWLEYILGRMPSLGYNYRAQAAPNQVPGSNPVPR